jgi:CRP-like cAMP-binding protein
MVEKLRYSHDLAETDEQAILNLPYKTKRLERQGYIIRERDTTTHSCLLLSGFAIRHKIVGDGARQIVAIHMKGDMVDLQNSFLTVADHSVQVLTDSDVAFIPREEIKKLAFERPAVGMAMWFDTLVDASVFREWIANVGQARRSHALVAPLMRVLVKAEGGRYGRGHGLRAADDARAASRRYGSDIRACEPHDQGLGSRRPHRTAAEPFRHYRRLEEACRGR